MYKDFKLKYYKDICVLEFIKVLFIIVKWCNKFKCFIQGYGRGNMVYKYYGKI